MVLQNLGKKNQFLICHTFVNTLCVRYGMLSGAIHAKFLCTFIDTIQNDVSIDILKCSMYTVTVTHARLISKCIMMIHDNMDT